VRDAEKRDPGDWASRECRRIKLPLRKIRIAFGGGRAQVAQIIPMNLEPLASTYLQGQSLGGEGAMVTKKRDVTVDETAIDAYACPSVMARLIVTTCLAVLFLGVWFGFFAIH
jgi:hypothetical protein